MQQFGPYLAPDPIEECIIVACKFDKGVILAKNRDRMYKPDISIRHEIIDGVEIAYIYDEVTTWTEGMNEYGIGFVNTALMVTQDEKEGKKKEGRASIIKSKEGQNILEILKQKTVEDAVKILKSKEVKGHSYICGPEGGYRIEVTSKHKMVIKKMDLSDFTVRTNHGIEYPKAGYTKGINSKSSLQRMAQAERTVIKSDDPRTILKKLRKQNHPKKSQLNMRRDTDDMVTTGQLALDLTNNVVHYVSFKEKQNFVGVKNKLPKNHTPKIKIKHEIIEVDKE